MKLKRLLATTVVAGTLAFTGGVNAGAIFSATSAAINSGGPGFGSVNDTFNQNGLSVTYTSGVTDFNSYLAGAPTHTDIFSGFEWFSNSGSTAASVTYDFGVTKTFDALALWNEEISGIGLLNLLTSTDGINFSALATGLTPFDNPTGIYPAEVFSFGAVGARYVRFDMSRCPQSNPGTFSACAIGEVAFRESNSVPEPMSLLLVGFGLFGVAVSRKRATK